MRPFAALACAVAACGQAVPPKATPNAPEIAARERDSLAIPKAPFAIVPADDGFTVEYRPAPDFDPSTCERVTRILHDVIGEPVAIRWQAVDHIAPSPSGKPQIIRPSTRPPSPDVGSEGRDTGR